MSESSSVQNQARSSDRDAVVQGLREKARVALFTGAYNHVIDGVSLTLNRLVGSLVEAEVPVHVFAPTVAEAALVHEGDLTSVPSTPMPGRPEYRISVGMGPKAIKAMRQFNPTLIHIATPDMLGLEALMYARARGIPVVASYHTHFSSYLEFYGMKRLEGAMWSFLRWFYKHCAHLYVPTQSMADVLAEHNIVDGVEIWPRGVQIDRFTPAKRSMELRRKLGFADNEVVVTFVSRLVIEKGLDVFAEVVNQLKDEGLPVRCLVVGEGPARAELTEWLPRAVFLGHQAGDDLAAAYASSDVFFFPSETETFGNVTLEAMASGLPTVCADATGSKSLVLDGKTGYLVTPRSIERFTDRVRVLIRDVEKRHEMGAAARAEAETYSWRIILGRIHAYYHRLLSTQSAQSD